MENVICFLCFLDLLQLAGSVAGRILMVCLVKAVVSSMRSTSAESRSPTGALDRASVVIWFLPVTCTTLGLYLHEAQSEGLNVWSSTVLRRGTSGLWSVSTVKLRPSM